MRERTTAISITVILALALTRCGGTTAPGGADASIDGAFAGDGAGNDASGGSCNPACDPSRPCCGGQCVNVDNDPTNCGACGVKCTGATSFCDGTCKAPPCAGGGCSPGGTCCGTLCCTGSDICCKIEGPIGGGPPSCFTPTPQQTTCPQGCAPLCKSDRNVKRDVVPVSGREVLDALSQVPMSTWSYNSEDAAVRHLGPMAQDFHAAFGLGATDRAYDPIDAHGVAFASIQALYAIVQEQNVRIDRLESENARLRAGDARCGR